MKKYFATLFLLNLTIVSYGFSDLQQFDKYMLKPARNEISILGRNKASQQPNLYSNNSDIYSNKIEVAIRKGDGNGNFTIGTSDGKKLLFDHPSPRSGVTTIRIDGQDYYYHYSTNIGAIEEGYPLTESNSHKIRWIIDKNIYLQQTLSLVPSIQPNVLDTVEIKYEIQNTDTLAHEVGLRLILDTMIGENDAAPFRIPTIGIITKEMEFNSEKNIPYYIDVIDKIKNPNTSARALFINNESITPDRVILADWNKIGKHQSIWDYTIDTNRTISDSCIGIYWYPIPIKPNSNKTIVTYYGLSKLNHVSNENLAVMISSLDTLKRKKDNSLSPNPFQVSVYLKNIGNETIKNTQATLILPDGLSIENSKNNTQTIGDITVSQEKKATWPVLADNSKSGEFRYKVNISASNITEVLKISKTIQIPKGNENSDPNDVSGCIKYKGEPMSNAKVLIIQSGEYHQKKTLDHNGCFSIEKVADDRPFSIFIRKAEE